MCFTPFIVEKRLRIEWWHWPDDNIRLQARNLLKMGIEELIYLHERVSPEYETSAIERFAS